MLRRLSGQDYLFRQAGVHLESGQFAAQMFRRKGADGKMYLYVKTFSMDDSISMKRGDHDERFKKLLPDGSGAVRTGHV